MNIHRVISQPWQLQASKTNKLKTVILPVTCTEDNNKYHVGDHIFLAKKWYRFEDSRFPFWMNWRSEETMPVEIAEDWFEITGVEITKLKNLTFADFAKSGIHEKCEGINYPDVETSEAWDEANPGFLWTSNPKVIKLEVNKFLITREIN
jgi:hypothetical protein